MESRSLVALLIGGSLLFALLSWLAPPPALPPSRPGGYHGVTLGATTLSGLPAMHALFDAPLPGFLHTRKPHFYREAQPGEDEAAFAARLARELDALIEAEGPDSVGAFFGEPLMAAGGVVPPPEGY